MLSSNSKHHYAELSLRVLFIVKKKKFVLIRVLKSGFIIFDHTGAANNHGRIGTTVFTRAMSDDNSISINRRNGQVSSKRQFTI